MTVTILTSPWRLYLLLFVTHIPNSVLTQTAAFPAFVISTGRLAVRSARGKAPTQSAKNPRTDAYSLKAFGIHSGSQSTAVALKSSPEFIINPSASQSYQVVT